MKEIKNGKKQTRKIDRYSVMFYAQSTAKGHSYQVEINTESKQERRRKNRSWITYFNVALFPNSKYAVKRVTMLSQYTHEHQHNYLY